MNSTDLRSALVSKQSASYLAALLSMALLYAVLAFGVYNGLTQHTLGANDFFSRWMGARALILQGQNPYSTDVTREIQMAMYGRLAHPDEDQVAFAYPLYAAYLAAPLVGLPYAVAQALWMALLILCVIGGALALAVVNRVVLSPFALAAIVLSVLVFYPSVRGIFLGQYALVSFACLAFTAFAIDTRHDTLAGILLGISTVKPQPIVFLLPVILFWAWRNGRRRVVWSALVTLCLLLVSSFVWVPAWFMDFLNGLRAYTQYARVGPPLEAFFKILLPENSANGAFLISSMLILFAMLILVWRNSTRTWFQFQPTLGLVALVTTLIAGRIGTPDQVLLLIPWIAWLAAWCALRKRVCGVSLGALLILPWYVFLTLLQGNQEAILVTTILPLLTLSVFLITRLVESNPQRVLQK